MLERDVASWALQRPRSLLDVDRVVEVLEDAVEERERGLHLEPDAEERADREEEPRLQGRECDDRADRNGAGEVTGEEVDERGHDGEGGLDRRHHPAAGHPAPHLELGETLRLAPEAACELVAAPHRLAEQDPRDRQRFLDEAGDVGHRLLAHLRHLATLVADALGQPDEERQQREREERQLPVEDEHRDDRRQHRGHVRDDRGRGRGDDLLDAADVVRKPGLHLAGARPGEECEREPLQVLVDGRAQIVHHPLADLVREQRLDDAERARDNGDRDHPEHKPVQQPQILLRQRLVDHLPQQQCGDDAERGGEEDQRQDARETPAVGAEQGDDPAQIGAAHRRIRGTLRRILVVERARSSPWHP